MVKHLFLTSFLVAVGLFFNTSLWAQSQPAPTSRGLRYWYTAADVSGAPVTYIPNRLNPTVSSERAIYFGIGSSPYAQYNSAGFGSNATVKLDSDDGYAINNGSHTGPTTSYKEGTVIVGFTTPGSGYLTGINPIYTFAESQSGMALFLDNDKLVFTAYGLNGASDDFNRLEYTIDANQSYVITAQFNTNTQFMELFVNSISVGKKTILFSSIDVPQNYHGTLTQVGTDGTLRITSSTNAVLPIGAIGEFASALIYNNVTLTTNERYQSESTVRFNTSLSGPPAITGNWFSCLPNSQFIPIVRYETTSSASAFLTDLSPNDLDATAASLPTYTSNAINSEPALLFAASKEIKVPSSMLLNKSNSSEERTYHIVAKPTSITTKQFIYNEGDQYRGMNIFIESSALHFTFYTSTGSGPAVYTTSSYSYPLANTDALVITIADKAGSPYIAVNGNIPSGLGSSFPVRPVDCWAKGDAYLGGNVGGTYDGTAAYTSEAPFTGYIAEFGIFNKAFSTEELTLLHNHQTLKYGSFINQARDFYRWQEFYPKAIGGLNAQVLSSCSDELLFKTASMPSGAYVHIGHNTENATDLLVGDHFYYDPNYTVPQNVKRSKKTWRVDQGVNGSPYPAFGGSTTIDFTLAKTDFPVSTIESYQKAVIIVDADGDFSKDARIYELSEDVTHTKYVQNGLVINAGDHISFGVINLYEYGSSYPYGTTYPYGTDFIYQTLSGTPDNIIDINGLQIRAVNGTSNLNYLGAAVNQNTGVEFNPMSALPKISCNWKLTHYNNVGPVEFTWDPASIGITTPLASDEEYVLVYEGNALGYGVFTQYVRFDLVNGKYKVPSINLDVNGNYELTILKRTIGTPSQVKTTLAVLKEVDDEISDNITKGFMKLYGRDQYVNGYQTQYSPASQCAESTKKSYLYLTFNTGDNYVFGNNAFASEVKVNVTGRYTPYAGPSLNFGTFTLNIDQSKPEQLQVIDVTDYINSYPFEEISIRVTSYTASGNTTINDALVLKAELIKERKVLVPQTTDPVITTQSAVVSTSNKSCTFTWTDPYCDPYTYQFQLLRLFNGATTTIPATEQDLINADLDWSKALTLETVNNTLTLTLAEGTGYYAWRVRPVGNYYEGDAANNQNWGPWNTDAIALAAPLNISASTDLLATYNGAVLYYNQFDEDKNFIYNRVFTEDTKIHEGISYANGLQQVNQTQAKVNSNGENGQIIVSESVYDFSGRASVQSMAAPDEVNNELGYRSGTLVKGTGKYNAFNFDADAKLATPDPIDNGLINLYYSDLNIDPQIPDAENYPYTRTLYDNDGINRTTEQSGVGKMHSIGNKTVTFEYSTASDMELLRLFGDEAPKGNTVQKTKTTDQNNVSSVTYTDLSGKVIATGLVKNDKTSNLEDLGTFDTQHIEDLLDNNTPIGDIGVTATKKYTFSETTDLVVKLSVDPYMISSDCGDFCATCSYLGEIKVTDDKTNIVIATKNINISGEQVSCSTAVASEDPEIITIEDIPTGTYTITKKVILNESAAAAYAESVRSNIDAALQTVIATHVMSYVDAKDFQGLADHLEALYANHSSLPLGYNVTINSTPAYVSHAETPLKTGDEVVIGPACCAVKVPIIIPELEPCEQYAKDLLDPMVGAEAARNKFANTLVSRYKAAAGIDPLVLATHPELGVYDEDNLKNLFKNMIQEPYYTCDDIWSAWQAQIVLAKTSFTNPDDPDGTNGYGTLVDKANTDLSGFPTVDPAAGVAQGRHPITMFLNELKRKDHLNGFLDVVDDELREYAYKFFYYNRSTTPPASGTVAKFCEKQYCVNPLVSEPDVCEEVDCLPERIAGEEGAYTLRYTYTDLSTLVLNKTNHFITDFYFCLNNSVAPPASGTLAETLVDNYYKDLLKNKTSLENTCKNTCDQKRGDFIAGLRKLYDPDGNGTLVNSLNVTLQEQDLCCTADQMVAYCKDQCYLSVVRERCEGTPNYEGEPVMLITVGTDEERNKVMAILNGEFQLQDAAGTETACSTGYERVEVCEELVGLYHLNGPSDDKDYAHATDPDFKLTYNTTSFTTGRTGESDQAFDAPYNWATAISEASTRGITKTVTVSAWVNMRNAITDATVKTIVKKMDSNYGFHLYTINGYLYFDVKDNGTTYSTGKSIYDLTDYNTPVLTKDPFIVDQDWHMVTGVCRGDAVEIWIDGQMQKSVAASVTTMATTSGLAITAGAATFEGKVDEVYIYAYPLGKAAILQLYNDTKELNLDYTEETVGSLNCPAAADASPDKLWDQAAGINTQMLGMKKVSTGKMWSYGSATGALPGERTYLVIVDDKGNKTEPVFATEVGQFVDMIELPNGNYGLLAMQALAFVGGADMAIFEFTPAGNFVAKTAMGYMPSSGFVSYVNAYYSAKLFNYKNQIYVINSINDQLRISPYTKGIGIDYYGLTNTYVFDLPGYLNNNTTASRFYNILELSGNDLFVAGNDRVCKIDLSGLASLSTGTTTLHNPVWEKTMTSDFIIHSIHSVNSGNNLTIIGDSTEYVTTPSSYTNTQAGIKNLKATNGDLNWATIQPHIITGINMTNPIVETLSYQVNHRYSMKSAVDGQIIMCGYFTEGTYGTHGFVTKINGAGDCTIFLDESGKRTARMSPTNLEQWIQYNSLFEDKKGNIYAFGYRGMQQGTDQMITKLDGSVHRIYERIIIIPTAGNYGNPPGGKHLGMFNNGVLLLGQCYRDVAFWSIQERTALPACSNPFPAGYCNDYWYLALGHQVSCEKQPLCIKWIAPEVVVDPVDPVDPPDPETVKTVTKTHITNVVNTQIGQCFSDNLEAIYNEYKSKCRGHIAERCTVSYDITTGHYTLYYFDRAGNLVQTVPPEGVELVTVDPMDIEAARQIHPAHRMKTMYKYNSLGQLIEQSSPDGGTSLFRYNKLSMLRFSQNAKQLGENTYSYSKYDLLGRIVEVGQGAIQSGKTFTTIPVEEEGTNTAFGLTSFPTSNTSQETFTVYTDAASHINYLGVGQKFLRNRVSYSFSKGMDGNKSVSYFSYDPHGNVNWIVQELPGIGKSTIGYDYDLISNKVIKVKLNENRPDQFFHRYSYDSDNRINLVETSPNGYLWDRDAAYTYYKHGPLRRTEMGEDHVQGLDYTYTLQGWIKALNAPTLAAADDPGQDGVGTSAFQKDEYGFVLGYYGAETGFNGDFKRTGSIFNAPSSGTQTSAALASNKPLYNGNITSWSSRIDAEETDYKVTANTYQYDFLNRIKESYYFKQSGTSNFTLDANGDYGTTYTYDANGNLEGLIRKQKTTTSNALNNLTYNYHTISVGGVPKKDNNRLLSVTDAVTSQTNNYEYDGIGNLTSDDQENVSISWNVYGKVDQVKQKVPSTSGKDELRFVYDAMGNRIEKEVNKEPYSGSLAPQRLIDKLETTYYVRDASGNVMSIYQRKNTPVPGKPDYYQVTFTIKEVPLYGSSRLGVQDERDEDVVVATKIFHKDDYYNVTFDQLQVDQKTELNNWLTTSTATDNLAGYQVPSVSLHAIDFNTAVPNAQAIANIQNFAGVDGKDVSVAEGEYGQVVMYTATMKKHWGKQNVLLLFDADGNIMPNSGGILADANARTVIVQSPANSKEYLLFTRNAADHKLYYHTISLDLQGNGANAYDKKGDIKNKNQAIDASHTYGTHLMAIEDRGSKKAYLYATQYKAPMDATLAIGTTELTLFEVSNSGTGIVKAPSKLCTEISSWEDLAQSQLQISPDGKKLTMINHKENLGWFGAQKTEMIVFNMGANYRLASNLIVDATIVPVGISMPHQSLDFSADSRYIYYSQQRLSPKLAYNTMNRFDLRNNIQSQNLFLDRLPQIQRSKYGLVYAYQNSNRWDAYTQNSTAVSSAEPTDDLLFSYLAGGNTITNHLPYQNRIVYKVSDVAPLLFSRRVGKKNYELSDHLGNVTVVVSDLLESDAMTYGNKAHVEAFTNYYAFGMQMPGRFMSSDSYRYGFNGKEKADDISDGNYDFGGRIYDSKIARWFSIDPLYYEYTSVTPYSFVANAPISSYDPDGRKIIFVNGNWQRGVIGWILGSSKALKGYWSDLFEQTAAEFFGDNSSSNMYVDGSSSWGGDMSGQDRFDAGYQYAKDNYESLIENLQEGEVFNIVTHSEGSAYGAGIAKYLIEKKHTVQTVVHLSSDEADEFTTPSEPDTYQLGYIGDWVTRNHSIKGNDIHTLVDRPDLDWTTIHGTTRNSRVFDYLKLAKIKLAQNRKEEAERQRLEKEREEWAKPPKESKSRKQKKVPRVDGKKNKID